MGKRQWVWGWRLRRRSRLKRADARWHWGYWCGDRELSCSRSGSVFELSCRRRGRLRAGGRGFKSQHNIHRALNEVAACRSRSSKISYSRAAAKPDYDATKTRKAKTQAVRLKRAQCDFNAKAKAARNHRKATTAKAESKVETNKQLKSELKKESKRKIGKTVEWGKNKTKKRLKD